MENVTYNQNSKIKSFLGGFLILLSLIVFFIVTRGFTGDVNDLKIALSEKEALHSSLTEQINSYEKDKEDLNLVSEVQRLTVNKAVPYGLNQDAVIDSITNVAEANGIKLNSIGFGRGGVLVEGIGILRINASFEGDYEDLVSFLEGVEKSDRLFKTNSISVQLSAFEVAGVRRTNFSFSLEAYYQI